MFNFDNTGVTVELGDIVESGVDIWAFDYPVPAETVTYNGKTAPVPFNKEAFEQKIIDHYRFRQIGQETVGRWLHYFRTRIREIMPYYIQLYEFEAKWFNIDDPLESYNLVETFEQETTGTGEVSGVNTTETSGSREDTGSTTATVAGEKVTKFSDTPQGTIANLEKYLTTATVEDDESTTTTTTTTTGADNSLVNADMHQNTTDTGTTSHTLTRKGNIGVQPLGSEVQNIRDAFINIDLMVINELKDLFLQVY